MKSKYRAFVIKLIFVLLAIAYLIKFQGPSLLRTYIEFAVVGSSQHAIFNMAPEKQIKNPQPDTEFLGKLIKYDMDGIEISAPKEFSITKEALTKVYYKKKKADNHAEAIYLICENPGFFVGLFPQLKRLGVTSDYEFIKRTMHARTKQIAGLTDALFCVTKGLFTPFLGDGTSVSMISFSDSERNGFINYNLSPSGNYFDANLIDNKNNFFKIYIRDKQKILDLDKFFTIISTVKKSS